MTASFRKIVVADDDFAIRRFIEITLSKAGYEVHLASDGAKALLLIRQHLPDLVITDGRMPLVDGYQLIKTLKEDPGLASIPVLMMGSSGSDRESDKGLTMARPDYHLPKPFDMEQLRSKVEQCLSSDRGVRS
jgi:DNA-binding response OmpR family regulator